MEVTKLCVFFFIVAAASAATGPDRRVAAVRQLVARVDLNNDGILTRDEIEAEFNAHDTNGDGRLTETEYVNKFIENNPRAPAMMARIIAKKMFAKLDKTNDQFVTQEEMWDTEAFAANNQLSVDAMTRRIIGLMINQGGQNSIQQFQQAAMDRAVTVADADADGFVSPEEFAAAAARHDANGDGQITRVEWLQGFMANNPTVGQMGAGIASATFDRIDANGDGVLTLAEMIPDLADIDTDGDGLVSVDEFKTHMQNTVHATQGHHQQNTIN